MPPLVVSGAMLQCTMGMAPGTFTATTNATVTAGMPIGVVSDMAPMSNIGTFGMCMSPANPQVAAATSAAMGVLTPQPCIPATSSPWTPGSPTVKIAGVPALDSSCQCMCMWTGLITISSPGQVAVSG